MGLAARMACHDPVRLRRIDATGRLHRPVGLCARTEAGSEVSLEPRALTALRGGQTDPGRPPGRFAEGAPGLAPGVALQTLAHAAQGG